MTRKLACRVDGIVAHGERVYTVRLRADRALPPFRPGQFLHLAIDPYDPSGFWPDSRAFSIASASSRNATLEICYAVKGRFTTRMERELAVGQTVWVKLPYGDFVVRAHDDVVLLAGGTGISAFTVYLESLSLEAPRSVVLGHGARTPALLLYDHLVSRLAATVPVFQAVAFAEQAYEPNRTIGVVPIYEGRLDLERVWRLAPRPLAAGYYLSGPPPMLRALGDDLRRRGVADEAIHIDAWE
jgi:ferredoxin-NADP reductase